MGTRQIIAALGNRCTDMASEYEGDNDLNEYLMNNNSTHVQDVSAKRLMR
ncbi:hypothetical protein JCM17724A_24390 [Prevotella fusca JCM 17724]